MITVTVRNRPTVSYEHGEVFGAVLGCFLGCYRGLAPRALKTPGQALARVDSWAGIVSKAYFAYFAPVGMLNRPLEARVTDVWEGLPWWVVAA